MVALCQVRYADADGRDHDRRARVGYRPAYQRRGPYVPRLAVEWLRETPESLWRAVEGTLAFVDIAGFTQLTERLARKGKVGAEEMSDILDTTFSALLDVAEADAADLVKWGGDAVRCSSRAPTTRCGPHGRSSGCGPPCGASAGSRRRRGPWCCACPSGVHSGDFDFFLVGDPLIHRELLITGPDATTTADMETAAAAGEIGLSASTASLLTAAAPRSRAARRPAPALGAVARRRREHAAPVDRGRSGRRAATPDTGTPAQRRREPEHRRIVVGFVQFSGTDEILAAEGPQALAEALDQCVRTVQDATNRHGVTFFESDINRDGGKFMLTAGAPLSADHDEERMLRAARHVVERVGRLPVRIGVNSGAVFAGDFGPRFRKTFSVKGDAINLAARVMGKAQPGQVLATQRVIERAASHFDVEPLPPFMVKGKSEPVEAVSVGRLLGQRQAADHDTPLLGREKEMAQLRSALAEACSGEGRLVELVGEPGIGKSRLVHELLANVGLPVLVTTGDEYERAAAYWPFRSLLRGLLGLPAETADEDVARRLHDSATTHAPELLRLASPSRRSARHRHAGDPGGVGTSRRIPQGAHGGGDDEVP